jgi:hypothetical protein
VSNQPPLPDRFDLYEASVQSPPDMGRLLRAVHGDNPTRLGEDFAGTADLARHWVATVPGGTAVAIDLDAEALARAHGIDGLTTIAGDVTDRHDHEPVDVLHAGNFSIGYLHARADLMAYLRRARERLSPGPTAASPPTSSARSRSRSPCRTGGTASTPGSSARPTR